MLNCEPSTIAVVNSGWGFRGNIAGLPYWERPRLPSQNADLAQTVLKKTSQAEFATWLPYIHDSRYSPPFQNINTVPLEILQKADMKLTENPDSEILLHTIHIHWSSANTNCAKAI